MTAITEGTTSTQRFGYFNGETTPWTYTVRIVYSSARAADVTFRQFSGSSSGGNFSFDVTALSDLLVEQTETFQILVTGTFGTAGTPYTLTFDYEIQDVGRTRDEYIDGFFADSASVFDPETETANFLGDVWGKIVAQREVDSQNLELRNAERYVLGVMGATDPGLTTFYVAGAPVYEAMKAVADLGGFTFMRSDPDIPTSAPGGVLDAYQGLIEGQTGTWTTHLPGGGDGGGLRVSPDSAALATPIVYQRAAGAEAREFTLAGVTYQVVTARAVPDVVGMFLFDDLGGRYTLSAGNDVLLSSAASNAKLGDGDDFATFAAASTVDGGAGNDLIILSDFGNTANGGGGNDTLIGGAGVDILNGGSGNDDIDGGGAADRMTGGAGNDTYRVDDAADEVREAGRGGDDIVIATVSYRLSAGIETLTLDGAAEHGTGNDTANAITGTALANTLRGEGGDDVLTGGKGKDVLTGGDGADIFVFARGDSAAQARNADRIGDFSHDDSDTIDLSGIDAIDGNDTVDAFTFIGTAAFSGAAGELRYEFSRGDTLLMGTANGDSRADFVIRLTGEHMLEAIDVGLGVQAFAIAGDAAMPGIGTSPAILDAVAIPGLMIV